jgi:hypothetical protein
MIKRLSKLAGGIFDASRQKKKKMEREKSTFSKKLIFETSLSRPNTMNIELGKVDYFDLKSPKADL